VCTNHGHALADLHSVEVHVGQLKENKTQSAAAGRGVAHDHYLSENGLLSESWPFGGVLGDAERAEFSDDLGEGLRELLQFVVAAAHCGGRGGGGGGRYVAANDGKVVDNTRHYEREICVCNGYMQLWARAQILPPDAAAAPLTHAASAQSYTANVNRPLPVHAPQRWTHVTQQIQQRRRRRRPASHRRRQAGFISGAAAPPCHHQAAEAEVEVHTFHDRAWRALH
jgi:hypothetical protein